MNWKEFFRPNKYKIILTIFIFILLSIYVPMDKCSTGGPDCAPRNGEYKYHTPFSCSFYPTCVSKAEYNFLNWTQRGPILLAEIIGAYLITCLLFIAKALKKDETINIAEKRPNKILEWFKSLNWQKKTVFITSIVTLIFYIICHYSCSNSYGGCGMGYLGCLIPLGLGAIIVLPFLFILFLGWIIKKFSKKE